MSWKLRRQRATSISIHAGRGGRSLVAREGNSLGGISPGVVSFSRQSADGLASISSSVSVLTIQMFYRRNSFASRRPKGFADVRPMIAADAANAPDVFVSFAQRSFKRVPEANHVRDTMPGGDQPPVCITRDFVPPHVAVRAIERFGNVHRQWRCVKLHVRIA